MQQTQQCKKIILSIVSDKNNIHKILKKGTLE